MKKKVVIGTIGVLSLCLALGLCILGRLEASPGPWEGPGSIAEGASAAPSGKRVLVAYFTHEGNSDFSGDASKVDALTSATVLRRGDVFIPQFYDGVRMGNTQVIAHYIARATGGTPFAIKVAEPYPVDAYDTLDRAGREISANARPALSSHVEDMSSFDTIYLGYPIWHGTMPMPVFSFLEEYDFAGKTIIPFSTHDGSGLGASRRDIQRLCPKAVVPEGLAVRYDRVRDAQGDVNAWIRKRQK